MKNQSYTVKQLAQLAGVGIKTLHYYDEIGLLPPGDHSAAGYRLYGRAELERLQEIMFYRALGFSLKAIHQLLGHHADRLAILRQQREFIRRRKASFDELLKTLESTIRASAEGENMPDTELFNGLANANAWNEALEEHNTHLKNEYGAKIAPVTDAQAMNEVAAEAASFMAAIAEALRAGVKPNAPDLTARIREHLAFLAVHGHPTDPQGFVRQTEFFMTDDFHYKMLEDQQTGLGAYIAAAARAAAA